MRILRHDNHLLWFSMLAVVGVMLYFTVSYTNRRVQASSIDTPHTLAQQHREEEEPSTTMKEDGSPTSILPSQPLPRRNKNKRVSFDTSVSLSTDNQSPPNVSSPQYVYLDLAKQDFLKDPYTGRVVLQLRPDVAPKTCANFVQLCEDKKYVNTPFHRVIKDFMLQGGDIVQQDGSGTYSIYGGEGSMFDDEPFVLKHEQAGVLSMANSGPNTNGSQFFITTQATPHLDGKHVVFGKVVQGMEFVHDIEREMTDANNTPIRKCYILNCGLLDVSELNASVPNATPPINTTMPSYSNSNSNGNNRVYYQEPSNTATNVALGSTGTLDSFPSSNMFGHANNTPPIEPSPFSL